MGDRSIRLTEVLVVPVLVASSVVVVITVLIRSSTWLRLADGMSDAMSRIQAENLIFGTVAQLIGGGFVLAGLYFSAKSFVVGRRAQSSERLAGALACLADDSQAVRLGGISILAGIARHSTSDDYFVAVDAICSFIRNTTVEDHYRASFAGRPPRADIQAALKTLATRRWSYRAGESSPLDLHGSFLQMASLRNSDLQGCDLSGADLTAASFWQAGLLAADLHGATVDQTDFRRADLRSCNLLQAAGEAAVFRGAVMTNTNFTRARIPNADLSGTFLDRVRFPSATLDGADFEGSRLVECDLTRIDLQRVDLEVAKLVRCVGVAKPRDLGHDSNASSMIDRADPR